MAKIGFLFPGQGAQYLGMGKELFENIKSCKELFLEGESILELPIINTIFNGTNEELVKTEFTQPAIVLTSLACLKALEERGISADYAAGLSLGEYTALVYGGLLSFEDGLKLVRERGRIMGKSIPKELGGMAAVLKLNEDEVVTLIERASEYGVVEGANYNCPGQVVIAGQHEAIRASVNIAKELGGRAIPLKVGGPFHSSLLKEASEEFFTILKNIEFNNLNKKIYSNVKGIEFNAEDDIKKLMKKQMMSPVLFESSIRNMILAGVDIFIEIGPGKVLSGFVKKIDRSVKVYNVEDLLSLENTVKSLEEIMGGSYVKG